MKIKTFVADDNSFSFSYPEFKGWEVKQTESLGKNMVSLTKNPGPEGWGKQTETSGVDMYKITFSIPPTVIWSGQAPQAIIWRTSLNRTVDAKMLTNPNGVPYFRVAQIITRPPAHPTEEYWFQGPKFAVHVSVTAGTEEEGFSNKKFFEEVIRTFKITGK